MNNPAPGPIGVDVWRRGAKLGLWIALVFFVVTLLIYLIMGLLGWDGVLRALCAMAVGPLVALAVIGGWWIVRRPTIAPPDQN
jgi:hypothetical protein